jgi:hypothetical protein
LCKRRCLNCSSCLTATILMPLGQECSLRVPLLRWEVPLVASSTEWKCTNANPLETWVNLSLTSRRSLIGACLENSYRSISSSAFSSQLRTNKTWVRPASNLLLVHHPFAAHCTEGRMYAMRNWHSHNWCTSKKTAPWCLCADQIYLDQKVLMPPSWLAELKEKLLPSTRRRLEDFF